MVSPVDPSTSGLQFAEAIIPRGCDRVAHTERAEDAQDFEAVASYFWPTGRTTATKAW